MCEHRRATKKEERNLFRGSKYVQSDVGNTFAQVKNDLINGLIVMYSGTPCQIDGLKRFLELSEVSMDNLISVDLVCHGVPSPRVWRDYLEFREKEFKSNIKAVDFRNKKIFGWKDHVETIFFENGKSISSRYYSDLFMSNYVIRRSCHECNYTSKNRIADITLADFWGIDKLDSSFNDNKGVSMILVSSDKGNKLFNEVKENFIFKEFKISDVNQTALQHPHYYKVKKEEFWRDYNNNNFIYIIKKYVIGNPMLFKIKEFIRNHEQVKNV